MVTEGEQISAILQFAERKPAEVFGRMSPDIPNDLDDRLRALASGELSVRERDRLLEKLVSKPELLLRLAEYLQRSED